MSANIDQLLERRQTWRAGTPGSPDRARSRLELSRFIAEHYVGFDPLRNHLFHPDHGHVLDKRARQQAAPVIERLRDIGWITPAGGDDWRPTDLDDSHAYLAGGWLEELTFCAHEAAGVDEACYGQDVEWLVDGIAGRNEIDIIARRGDVLSFTSCKTIQPQKSPGKNTTLRGFLSETDYWNIHFANDRGRALLVVTADFLDEMRRNRHRYPELLARASVLEVSLVGLEELRWDRLIERIHGHWRRNE